MCATLRGQLPGAEFFLLGPVSLLAFAQLTFRESLRDIVACLHSQERRLYHLGIRGTVSRSTLADANESRDWRIYADFAQLLIAEARRLYRDQDLGLDLANTVYALDSTTIDAYLASAKSRRRSWRNLEHRRSRTYEVSIQPCSNTTSAAMASACASLPLVSTITQSSRTGRRNRYPSRIRLSTTCCWQRLSQ